VTIPFDIFYDRIAKGADTRTSQVNISEYVAYFSEFLEKGLDIVHVCLSSGISGTVNSARNAALIAKERYPERNVYIVDSLAAASVIADRIGNEIVKALIVLGEVNGSAAGIDHAGLAVLLGDHSTLGGLLSYDGLGLELLAGNALRAHLVLIAEGSLLGARCALLGSVIVISAVIVITAVLIVAAVLGSLIKVTLLGATLEALISALVSALIGSCGTLILSAVCGLLIGSLLGARCGSLLCAGSGSGLGLGLGSFCLDLGLGLGLGGFDLHLGLGLGLGGFDLHLGLGLGLGSFCLDLGLGLFYL
jgi:hypothetical protein